MAIERTTPQRPIKVGDRIYYLSNSKEKFYCKVITIYPRSSRGMNEIWGVWLRPKDNSEIKSEQGMMYEKDCYIEGVSWKSRVEY